MSDQVGFEPLAQGGVAVAGAVEKGPAEAGRLFQRARKKRFFPVLRRWHDWLSVAGFSLHGHWTEWKKE